MKKENIEFMPLIIMGVQIIFSIKNDNFTVSGNKDGVFYTVSSSLCTLSIKEQIKMSISTVIHKFVSSSLTDGLVDAIAFRIIK
jgi:hypothetical protein